MDFDDYLPGVIVLGYALMTVAIWGNSKLRRNSPRDENCPETNERSGPPPPAGARPITAQTLSEANHLNANGTPPAPAQVTEDRIAQIRRWAAALKWAAVIVGVVTTATWLGAGSDWDLGTVFVIVGSLVGFIALMLVIGLIMQSDGGLRKVFGGLLVGIVAAALWFLLLPPVLYLTGLTQDVTVQIASSQAGERHGNKFSFSSVRGSYPLDGTLHDIEFMWLNPSARPEAGHTIEVGISPVWPGQVYAKASGAWIALGVGVFTPVIFGGSFALGLRLRSLRHYQR